jgi:hypothetical protein
MENAKCSGFFIDIKKPYKPGFALCMVITPHFQDGRTGVDTSNKLERDMGRKMAIDLAAELLKHCDAPLEIVQTVKSLHDQLE